MIETIIKPIALLVIIFLFSHNIYLMARSYSINQTIKFLKALNVAFYEKMIEFVVNEWARGNEVTMEDFRQYSQNIIKETRRAKFKEGHIKTYIPYINKSSLITGINENNEYVLEYYNKFDLYQEQYDTFAQDYHYYLGIIVGKELDTDEIISYNEEADRIGTEYIIDPEYDPLEDI